MANNVNIKTDVQLSIERLIAIWALSEAALGGVLHAFRIPLTGIFINSTAVIIITLIAWFSDKKGIILKATLVVLLVKAAVSPHTPLNAYLAVSLQGIIGEVLFSTKRFFKISAFLLGVTTLFLSGVQKIIVLTILFGQNLWDSIDTFGNYVLQQFAFLSNSTNAYEVSYWLIVVYVGLHVVVGVVIGIFAGRIPHRIKSYDKSSLIDLNKNVALKAINNQKKKRIWYKKPSAIAVILLAAAIVILTYIYPQFSDTVALKAVIMVVRSILIMTVWYFIAGPFFLKLYQNYIKKYKSRYARDVESTINILPQIKTIVVHSWKFSVKFSKFSRIKHFILVTLFNLLALEKGQNEENISADGT